MNRIATQVLWHKVATSGLVQQVEELRIDDEQDAVWLPASGRADERPL
ncbi:phosphoribosyl-AMP cyclohydrolase [Marinobacterium iners]|nr:phosphoribosyl-AMP cyclohydrolase [Marinobacterium iners]